MTARATSGSAGGGGTPRSGLASEILPVLREKVAADSSRKAEEKRKAADSALIEFADDVQEAAERERRPAPVRKLVSFFVCGAEYALPIDCVREILRIETISPVPQAPDHIRGVTNVRGRVVPVVEISTRLGGEPVEITAQSCIVAVEYEGRVLGLLVERASSVVTLSEDAIESPPEEVLGDSADYVTSVGKHDGRIIILLELERLLKPSTAWR